MTARVLYYRYATAEAIVSSLPSIPNCAAEEIENYAASSKRKSANQAV